MLGAVKKVLLWDYARASWQYDVIVIAILAFIFATPRSFFRDQPRVPYSSQIAVLPASDGHDVFWINTELVASFPANLSEAARLQHVSEELRRRTGKKHEITYLEPIFDSEQEIRGYMAVGRK